MAYSWRQRKQHQTELTSEECSSTVHKHQAQVGDFLPRKALFRAATDDQKSIYNMLKPGRRVMVDLFDFSVSQSPRP